MGEPGEPCYVGMSLDIIDDAMRKLEQLLAGQPRFSEGEARQLVQGEAVPPRLAAQGAGIVEQFSRIIAEMWADLGASYADAWGRPQPPLGSRHVPLPPPHTGLGTANTGRGVVGRARMVGTADRSRRAERLDN